jgi:hypothetical protein
VRAEYSLRHAAEGFGLDEMDTYVAKLPSGAADEIGPARISSLAPSARRCVLGLHVSAQTPKAMDVFVA